MIRSFRHRGLKRFYERGDRSLIRPDLHDRVEAMPAQLDVAGSPDAMRLPHYRLHCRARISGDMAVRLAKQPVVKPRVAPRVARRPPDKA